jgi:hypothetical protein
MTTIFIIAAVFALTVCGLQILYLVAKLAFQLVELLCAAGRTVWVYSTSAPRKRSPF